MGHLRFGAAAFVVCALLVLPASAPAATKWLCGPGVAANPCTSPLTTTVLGADGSSRVAPTAVARSPKVDCFYVYPTVSAQPTINADLTIDPEQTAIARYQASRFSSQCRVFAPVYRQLTLKGISTPRKSGGASEQKAYTDVRAAWREYLRRHNKGRGVVLIGHSQGTYMLRELIKREIDDAPAVRRKLVSALLIGGNVEVRKGSDRGGDFDHVPLCRRAAQVGCAVAYSMFDAQPPADARFGRASSSAREVACTNPAALGGGPGRVDAYNRTDPFPGTLGIAVNASTDPVPGITTPWVAFPGRATAACKKAGRLSWLQITSVPGDPRPTFRAAIGASWGLHLGDVNIALGQLVAIVGAQVKAFSRG